MIINISQTALLPVLQSVSRSCGVKAQLPVLNNLLFSAKEGKLRISATNLEIGVVKAVSAEIIEEGEVTIPARTLVDIVSNLNGQTLELKSSDDQLSITSPGFSAQINGISATEFPVIPMAGNNEVSLEAAVLLKSLPEVAFSAAVDEGRPVLTGILTEMKDKKLQMVATDGYRLAFKTVEVEEPAAFKALIPRRTLEEVARLISESEEDKVAISTAENQNQMVFSLGDTTLSSRLIDGQFPAWERIIPTEIKTTIKIDKNTLLKAVKLSAVFARNEANVIKFQISGNKMVLTSEAKELGSQTNEVEIVSSGEDMTIAFNAKFVQDALTALPGAKAVIELSGPLAAARIKPADGEDLSYIIMPVNLS